MERRYAFAAGSSVTWTVARHGTTAPLAVRRAALGDVEAITRIYNQGIEDRVATLETELRTPDERREWLTARGDRHPVLVAERDGQVLGWASLNRFNPRPAYDHVADFSIYVAREARGQGMGRVQLPRVIDEARRLGVASVGLSHQDLPGHAGPFYEKLGFRYTGKIEHNERVMVLDLEASRG